MKLILYKEMLVVTGLLSTTATSAKSRPNIILFLVDDMGWQDTSVPFWNNTKTPLNQRYHTPNMERLAAMGVRFTSAYACPVSSPSRCSLMTGMNAARHRVTNWTLNYNQETDNKNTTLNFPAWHVNGIQPDTVTTAHNTHRSTPATTLPQILRQNGYYTIHCGKAHFGAKSTPGANPLNMGFDINIAGSEIGGPSSYLAANKFGSGSFQVKGLEKYHGQDLFLTECLTREALEALKIPIQNKQPFYLYMSHYAIHGPYNKDSRFYDKYINKHDEQLKGALNHSEACFAALVEGMDKSLGDILDFLEQDKKVAQNTIVLFMSDNGGQANAPRQGQYYIQNAPLHAGKGSAYEGGVREPMIVYLPGKQLGGTCNDNPIMIEDFFPTILNMAGIKKYKTRQKVDGISFLPLLQNPSIKRKRTIVWHYPNLWGEVIDRTHGYGTTSTILKGHYKLIYFWETGEKQLFNIKEDIGEQQNLITQKPLLAKQLAEELTRSLKSYKAQRPSYKTTGALVPYPDGSNL